MPVVLQAHQITHRYKHRFVMIDGMALCNSVGIFVISYYINNFTNLYESEP